jgi:hypothetical protein
MLWELLKTYSPNSYGCWLFENKLPLAHTDLSAAFYLLHTAVGDGTMKYFGAYSQWCNEHFKPRMLFFFQDGYLLEILLCVRWWFSRVFKTFSQPYTIINLLLASLKLLGDCSTSKLWNFVKITGPYTDQPNPMRLKAKRYPTVYMEVLPHIKISQILNTQRDFLCMDLLRNIEFLVEKSHNLSANLLTNKIILYTQSDGPFQTWMIFLMNIVLQVNLLAT